jgi:hypothetical protein
LLVLSYSTASQWDRYRAIGGLPHDPATAHGLVERTPKMAETRLTGNWFLSIKIYTLHDHPDGFDKSKPLVNTSFD